ncbi:MAG: PPOX class F420-dependent oxidoreductase [Pseudomonadota bacterium]
MLSQELLSAKYISFATQKRDGSMVATPVWAGNEDTSLFVFSEADAGKVKRLRNFSQATVAPCTAIGRVTGNTYHCDARILESDLEIQRAYKALNRKYGFLMRVTDFFSKLTGRYDNRALIQIDVGKQTS